VREFKNTFLFYSLFFVIFIFENLIFLHQSVYLSGLAVIWQLQMDNFNYAPIVSSEMAPID